MAIIPKPIAKKLDASPHIVDDWRNAWRWASTRSMAFAGSTVTAWAALPADWRAAIPHWLFASIVIFQLTMGIIGRVVVQTPPEGGEEDDTNNAGA